MADASLNIPITADASKFISTLGQVEDKLKELKAALKDAVGGDIAKINFDIQGLEQQKKSIKEFGQFAEGTYGRLLQQLDYLRDYKLTLKTDSEEFNRTIGQIKEIEDTINRVNGKGIKLEAEIVQPPKGSIQYYQDRIKALESERAVLTADSTSLERANVLIDGYTNKIKNLKSQGISVPIVVDEEIVENSILGIRKKIDELNAKKIRIGVSNEGELAKLNSQIKEYEQEIVKANSLTIDENGGISKNANKARQAITSLSLVAQDLPFGFIAIQNNLPAVLENFTQLGNKSGGLKGALKDLGSTLMGPAGIFLAFSAVTAGVTYAIKEYGSLGNAYNALVKGGGDVIKLQNKLSEGVANATSNVATEEAKIASLTKILFDSNKSQEERLGAYDAINKITPDVLAGITKENALTSESAKLIRENIVERGKLVRLKITEAGINAALADNAKSLAIANADLTNAQQAEAIAKKNVDNNKQQLNSGLALVDNLYDVKAQFRAAQAETKIAEERVKALTNAQVPFLAQLDEVVAKENAIITVINGKIEAQKKDEKAQADAIKNAKTARSEAEKQALAELNERIKRQEYLNKIELKGLRDAYEERRKIEREVGATALVPTTLPTTAPSLNINTEKLQRDKDEADKILQGIGKLEALDNLQEQLKLAYTAINQVFFAPLENLFETFLNTGKIAFKDFTKSVLKSITDIAAKLAATGIIKGLMFLLDPSGGLASMGGSFGGVEGGNGILDALGGIFGRKEKGPRFNSVSGSRPGGERVEFTIRGTNLVGVLNRANGEINRIG